MKKVIPVYFTEENGYMLFYGILAGEVHLPIVCEQLSLMEEICGNEIPIAGNESGVVLNVSDQCYLEFEGMAEEEIRRAFQKATLLNEK